jgi:hypothetical protein
MYKTLEHIAFTLKRVEPGALFKSHSRTGFILDASLNDTRTFLVQLLAKNKGSDPKMNTLGLKVLLTLAVVRRSIEDVLTVCSLLADETIVKGEVDLREEILMLKASVESMKKEDAEEEEFDPTQPSEIEDDVKSKLMGLINQEKFNPTSSCYPSWVVDGDFVYMLYSDGPTLTKMSLGSS